MDALLFIAIPTNDTIDEDSQFAWFHQTEEQNNSGCDNLADFKDKFPNTSCIAVLPAQKVFETHSELLIKNRKQLEQALKFDLEEQLAAEVDTLHFAYQRDTENQLAVSVIEKAYLENLIQYFSEQGVVLQQLISETSLLAQAPEEWLIIQGKQQLLLKAKQYCYPIESDNLLLSLKSLQTDLPEDIPVYSTSHFDLETPLTHFSPQSIDNYFVKLCQYYSNASALNLLQGSYKVKTPQTWLLILATGAATIVIFSSLCFYQLYQNHELQQQEASLENKITAIYKKSFPKARRIINPYSQMRSGLKKLQNNQAQTGDFIPLLAKLSRTLRTQDAVQLNQLDYQNQSINISFSTPSLAKLEYFKNALSQQGLKASVSSINKEEDHITAQLLITGGRS